MTLTHVDMTVPELDQADPAFWLQEADAAPEWAAPGHRQRLFLERLAQRRADPGDVNAAPTKGRAA